MDARRRRRRGAPSTAALLLAALTAAGSLAGCGDDATEASSPASVPADGADESSSPGTAPTAPSAGGASASKPPAAEEADPGAPPAGGPTVRGSSFSLRAPEGWVIADPVSDFVRLATDPSGSGDIVIGFLEAADGATVDSLEDVAVQLWPGAGRPASKPRVEVDGVELYHLSGRSETGVPTDEYGTEADGLALSITFDLPGLAAAERRVLIESVLATIEWR